MIRYVRMTLALLAAAAALVPARALAESKAPCDIFEIKASSGEGGLDRDLKPLAKKLKKPPFSAWKTFEVLEDHDETLAKMKASELGLVTGGKLSLLLRDVAREENKKPRLRLTFTLDDERGKRKLDGTIHLDAGDYYLIGGDALEGGGTYILAIGCKAK